MLKRILFYSIIIHVYCAYAGDLDLASQEGLEKTKELLMNAQKRMEHIRKDAGAQQADETVQGLGATPEQNQKLYELAASIFEKMVKENKGDANEVNRLLKQKPEAFAGGLNEDHMKQIRDLAKEIEQNQGKMPSP